MGLFDKNINKYIEEFKAEDGILLVDVREADEYALGRSPGSMCHLAILKKSKMPYQIRVLRFMFTACQVVVVIWQKDS